MKIVTPVILIAASLALASPALAKTSLTKGEKLCKTAVAAQTPAPAGARVDDDETRTSDTTLWFTFKTRDSDGRAGQITCTVDRNTEAVSLASAD